MRIQEIYNAEEITKLAKERFQEERKLDHLEGWFWAREIAMECDELYKDDPDSIRIGKTLIQVMKRIPLTIGSYHVFAGTQDDAFARSYALINPAFQVSSFTGYCDPTAVFGDIDPIGDITEERISKVKDYYAKNKFAKKLTAAYAPAEKYTKEAVFFMEQVTGHLIPNVRHFLKDGALTVLEELSQKQKKHEDKKDYYESMKLSVQAMLVLAERYSAMAQELAEKTEGKEKSRYTLMAETLKKVPAHGAENLTRQSRHFY